MKVFVDTNEMIDAYELQRETLLYPMDGMILAMANGEDAPLVTLDSELLENGAKSPSDLL